MAACDNLSHLDDRGELGMVDIGAKAQTNRQAIATGRINMNHQAFSAILSGNVKKGDVFACAKIAGIMAAKRTDQLIPLCHSLALTSIAIEISPDSAIDCCLTVTATVKCNGATGAEMEALSAVTVACLTIYDMAKSLDKSMVIGTIMLLGKSGGKSGNYSRVSQSSMANPLPENQ